MRTCRNLLLMLLVASAPVRAADLGDPAPELRIAEWLKGEPVVLVDGKDKNIYVIEIWATTCAHCRAAVPRLTEMQKKYADQNVVFIAVSTEEAETLKAFVAEMGEKLEYRVAADQEQVTARAYMRGFRVGTVPHAFVVDQSGNVVWHGHPMFGLQKALDAILGGTYDIEARRRVEQARRSMPRYIHLLRSSSQTDKAGELGEEIISDGQDDPMLMKELAWTIVARPGLVNRDLELAQRAAQIAYDACEGRDAGIVATYARVLFENGKKKEAVEYQQKAVKLAEGLEFEQELQETLDAYRLVAGE
jgi:thiol-disulfide isomerase/thioredoxin